MRFVICAVASMTKPPPPGLHHAHLAIAAGGDDATALAVAAFVIGILEQDYQTAFNAFDPAKMALSPSSAQAFGFSSIIRAWAGDSRTSVEHAAPGIYAITGRRASSRP